MKKCIKIKSVNASEVLDSRGNPTVQVEVATEEGFSGKAMVPSGASTGSFEAIELRDNDKTRYFGKGVLKAVENVNNKIAKELIGMNVYDQINVDKKLIELDGTENKQKLGANAMLGVSLAIAKAAANSLEMSLYNYIGGINAKTMPLPMINILNGGRHAGNNLSIQEFMIVPIGEKTFRERIRTATEVYHHLKELIASKNLSTAVGDEGGFAPDVEDEEEAIKLIIQAIENAGYVPGKDVCLALDIAATELYEEAKKVGKEGYLFWKENVLKTKHEMIKYIEKLTVDYPIISIEDGLAEEDWDGWKILTEKIGDKVHIVGDDLFVTNVKRLKKGIDNKSANSILIKLNQIGTLTETLDAIELAKKNGFKTIISHRSGETEDTTIADLAVAINSEFIKTGAICRSERVAKYNRLLNIEDEIK